MGNFPLIDPVDVPRMEIRMNFLLPGYYATAITDKTTAATDATARAEEGGESFSDVLASTQEVSTGPVAVDAAEVLAPTEEATADEAVLDQVDPDQPDELTAEVAEDAPLTPEATQVQGSLTQVQHPVSADQGAPATAETDATQPTAGTSHSNLHDEALPTAEHADTHRPVAPSDQPTKMPGNDMPMWLHTAGIVPVAGAPTQNTGVAAGTVHVARASVSSTPDGATPLAAQGVAQVAPAPPKGASRAAKSGVVEVSTTVNFTATDKVVDQPLTEQSVAVPTGTREQPEQMAAPRADVDSKMPVRHQDDFKAGAVSDLNRAGKAPEAFEIQKPSQPVLVGKPADPIVPENHFVRAEDAAPPDPQPASAPTRPAIAPEMTVSASFRSEAQFQSAQPQEAMSLVSSETPREDSRLTPRGGQVATPQSPMPRPDMAHPNFGAQRAATPEAIRISADGNIDVAFNQDDLGRAHLRMHGADQSLNVQIVADRVEPGDHLRRNMDGLEQDLRRLGYSMVEWDFRHEQRGGGDSPQSEMTDQAEDGDLTDQTQKSASISSIGLDVRI